MIPTFLKGGEGIDSLQNCKVGEPKFFGERDIVLEGEGFKDFSFICHGFVNGKPFLSFIIDL